MSILDRARPELLRMQPYSSARLEAGAAAVMLNANELPFHLLDDQRVCSDPQWHRYPEPQPKELLAALARVYQVTPEQIFVGRGSDEAIDLLTRAFCRAGVDQVVIQPPTFGMYKVAAQVQGAQVVEVPLLAEADFQPDFPALEQAIGEHTKIVYLCTPNNPTGGEIATDALWDFLERTRDRCLVVVDEAYAEFSGKPSISQQLHRFPHLAVLRTLSKAYGLAGVRVGALLADPAIVGLLRRIMAPYPMPRPSVSAALEVLQHQEAAERAVAQIRVERERVAACLRGLSTVRYVWPSSANFLTFRVADATGLYGHLASSGVLVRNVSHYLGLTECLRVSIGSVNDNAAFLAAMRLWSPPNQPLLDRQTKDRSVPA